MYSLVIADDEPIILRYLENEIDWNAYGFSLKGVASDGLETLELVRAVAPHLLILDIQMPNMDGIEVLRRVRRESPATLTIILSAYSLFSYAQEAIRNDAIGYLLKPIDAEQLDEMMIRASRKLQERGTRPVNVEDSADPVILAQQYMERHFSENVSLESVAEHCFVSPSYLSKAFRTRLNCGFSEYLTKLRINEAKRLLTFSRYKVQDIALTVGFNDLAYFCRVFKRATGKTPLEYKCKLG